MGNVVYIVVADAVWVGSIMAVVGQFAGIETVSYTHLDVYKRQVMVAMFSAETNTLAELMNAFLSICAGKL